MGEMGRRPAELTADLPEGFKMTELGPLPEDWEVVPLSNILGEVDLRLCDLDDPVGYSLPVLSLTKNDGLVLQTERFGRRIATEDVSNYKVVRAGQIVYNPYVIWEGAIHILRHVEAGLVSPVYPVWNVERRVADPEYVDHLLRMPFAISAYNQFAAGAVNRRRSIRKDDFLKIEIPLPPLPEQRAIAHVLRTVQRAKEATERVIQATLELKRSLMRHLFTYGPVPVDEADKVPLRETEIGPVPEHWEVERLGKVAVFVRDSINPANYPDEVFDYYSIPAYHLVGGSVAEAGKEIRSQKLIVEAKDVLFGKLNPRVPKVLLVAPSRRRKISSTEFIPLRGVPGLIAAGYLYYLCWSDYVMPKAQELISGSTPSRQRVDARAFSLLLIPLPPLPEQRKIARILEVVDKKLGAEEARKQALDSLFKTLLHHLMTGKVRVKHLATPEVKEGVS